jgi:HEAT repeat protein
VSHSHRWRRRSEVERLRDRGDVRRLVRVLDQHDWVLDRDGVLVDLAVAKRIEAVSVLATIDDPSAEDGIARALHDDDPRVRRTAVQALGPAPSTRAAKALARATARWREPASAAARRAALELLVELADELNAVEYAQVLVETGHDDGLSDEEHAAIERLFAADSGPVAEIFARELVERLDAADVAERRLIQEMLIAMGSTSVEALLSVLEDPARRRAAAAALGEIRNPRAVPALVDVLAHGPPDTRPAAARALGQIRDPRALDALIRASGDPDVGLRDAALEALDRMRGVVALLGTAGLVPDKGAEDRRPPPGDAIAQQPPPVPDATYRSLLQRLLGR